MLALTASTASAICGARGHWRPHSLPEGRVSWHQPEPINGSKCSRCEEQKKKHDQRCGAGGELKRHIDVFRLRIEVFENTLSRAKEAGFESARDRIAQEQQLERKLRADLKSCEIETVSEALPWRIGALFGLFSALLCAIILGIRQGEAAMSGVSRAIIDRDPSVLRPFFASLIFS